MLDTFICCLYFEYMHICVWAFPLRCYYFFLPVLLQNECYYFFACCILAFCIVFTYPSHIIIYLLACILFCFFELNIQPLACLIFCNRFVHHFIVFFAKLLTFALFVFLQILAGATSSFSAYFCHCCLLFFAIQNDDANKCMKYCSYCICVAFIVAFFDSFRACFFVVQMSRVHQFCACSFSGFLRLSFVFSLCFYLCTFISYCAPLDSPTFLPIILSDHPDYPCQLPDFSCCHQTLQKRLLLAHFGGFLPCFCFPLCPCIHSHSPNPIYTHLHSFSSFFVKLPKT